MPTFERNGLASNYLDQGDPSWRPFASQHGLGGDVSQPAGVFSPPLGVRLLSLDCRGHGGTLPLGPADKLSFSSFADDVRALMDHLALQRAACYRRSLLTSELLTRYVGNRSTAL